MQARLLPLLFLPLQTSLQGAPEIPLAERLAQLEAKLEAMREQVHVAGCSIAVVQDDELVYSHGFGLARIEEELPATPETLYAIGSASKAFTATLVGMLVDEGKLAWDAPITDILPDFELPIDSKDPAAVVSLRDLLSHRTGFARADLLWAGNAASQEQILATVVHAKPWAEFRSSFHYNNIMFLAAGVAAAKVAEKPYVELMRERILAPLGMKSTNLSVRESQADPRLAWGYHWDAEKERQEHDEMRALDAIAPAGAINSNVLDMAQWLRFQLGRGSFEGERLISEASHTETWSSQNPIGNGSSYGMGWFLQEREGERVVQHGGNIDGFSSMVAMLPDRRLGFVLLTNAGATPLQNASLELVWSALIDDFHRKETTSDHTPYLGTYIANFASFQDAKFVVQEKDGKLAVDVPGQMLFTLKEPNAEGRWEFEITDQIGVSFESDAEGKPVVLRMHQKGLVFEVPREGYVPPAEVDLGELERFLGKYHDDALDGNLTVVVRNNRLAVDIPRQMVCELHAPDEEGKWVFRVNPALAVRFDEDQGGGVHQLTFFERGTTRACPRLAEAGSASSLPTLEEIAALRKDGERGAALAALGGLRMRGKVQMVHMGVEGTLSTIVRGQDCYRITVDLRPFALMETAYCTGTGATKSSLAPYEELSGRALAKARVESPALVVGNLAASYEKLTVLRAEELDGRQTWVLRAQATHKIESTYWIDAETGDILREDSQLLLPGESGSMPRTTRYSDYREVEGLRIPHRIVSRDDPSGESILVLEQLEPHLALEDADFSLR